MILVVGGIKGGSGKTTVATNLAQMRSATVKKVLLVDADEQKSSYDWSLQRDENRLADSAPITTICLQGKAVYTNLLKMAKDYDDIIVDTGGRDTSSQRAALCVADKFLIPFKPRSIDIWTIGLVSSLINECSNQNLKSYVFINQADPTGQDNADALAVLAECEHVACLPVMVGNRKIFGNAAAQGLGVFEVNPTDEKACKELENLYNVIYTTYQKQISEI